MTPGQVRVLVLLLVLVAVEIVFHPAFLERVQVYQKPAN